MIRAGSLEQKEAVARDAATARRLKEEAHDRWRMAWRIAAKVVDRLPLRATDGWTNVGLTNVQRMHKRIRMAVARRYDSSYRRLLQHFMRALDVVYNQTLRACDTDRSMCLTQKDIANSIHALLTQWNADYLGRRLPRRGCWHPPEPSLFQHQGRTHRPRLDGLLLGSTLVAKQRCG